MGRGSGYEGVRASSRSSIEISFYYLGEKCRERLKGLPNPSNLLKAAEFRAAVIESIKNGSFEYWVAFPESKAADRYRPAPPLTVKGYLEKWLDEQEKYLKTSTWSGYHKIIKNQLIPAFGEIILAQLSKKIVSDWLKSKAVTPKTAGNIISPLRTALDDAVEDELIDHNPLANWRIKRKRGQIKASDDIDPFDADERAAILSVLTGQNKNMVLFWFWTGLRPSELIALDWSDIDFVHSKVRVNKALTQAATAPELPKTEAGDRYVDLLPPAITALKAQKDYTYLAGQEIFQNPRTGARWGGDAPIRKTMWIHALKRAGVRYRYPYQCRHSFATMMLDAGENIRWISAQLGHTDWTFTARTYTRYMPQAFEGAGSKAVELFGGIEPDSKREHK